MARGETYSAKRSFERTPEPPPEVEGDVDPGSAPPGERFVIHQHHARRLHFDLRLEMMNGATPVLVSWAVPKNLPLRKGERHLAVHVEDHPIDYAGFSGTIPEGNYGAGEVRIFDEGSYELLEQAPGKLTFRLRGQRLRGVWHLVQTRGDKDWLAFLRAWEGPERDPPPPLEPMLATLVADPFDDDRYLFEFKWDGVRTLAVCTDTETKLVSRSGRDVSATYPELARLHERLVCLDAIVDGEVVAFEGERPSFEKLQGRINLVNARDIERASKRIPVCFVAFDLIYLDGRSLLAAPLERRRELLEQVVVPGGNVLVSPAVPGAGEALFEVASKRRFEGIVAKRLGSPYRPGKRTREWLKVKATTEADLVVGGWTQGEGSRASSFGALLVGAYSGEGLVFLGAVGTGFTEAALAALVPRLEELRTAEAPFAGGAAAVSGGRSGKPVRDPRWVRPELVCRVEYRELTSAARLRAPSFKGLRDDVAPEQCRLEDLIAARDGTA